MATAAKGCVDNLEREAIDRRRSGDDDAPVSIASIGVVRCCGVKEGLSVKPGEREFFVRKGGNLSKEGGSKGNNSVLIASSRGA